MTNPFALLEGKNHWRATPWTFPKKGSRQGQKEGEQEKEKQHLEAGQELNSKISALEEDLASIRGSLTTAESERDNALQECVINFTKFVV